jgi:hypothetical protein
VTSAFVSPASLLHATRVARGAVSPQSLLASAGTQVYLRLGSSYQPITSAHLANLSLSFDTPSLVLLGEVLRAAADGGRVSHVSLAFRTPGPGGRPVTERVDTFATALVTSMAEHFSSTPTGSVSLLLSPGSDMTSTPGTLQHAGAFPPLSAAPTTRAYVTLGTTGRRGSSYAVTAVSLSQAATGAPFDLGFTTSAMPLLHGMLQARGAGSSALTLSVRTGTGAGMLRHTFSGLSVRSLAEKRSGSLSGTATLAAAAR